MFRITGCQVIITIYISTSHGLDTFKTDVSTTLHTSIPYGTPERSEIFNLHNLEPHAEFRIRQ